MRARFAHKHKTRVEMTGRAFKIIVLTHVVKMGSYWVNSSLADKHWIRMDMTGRAYHIIIWILAVKWALPGYALALLTSIRLGWKEFTLHYVMSRHVTSRHVTSRHATSRHVTLS